jgi:nitrogen fixation protein NifU and related proteins
MRSERLIDHFRNPRNVGELPPPAIKVDVVNPACGDMLRLSIQVSDGVIEAAAFKARGCVASIATASALTELLRGKTLDQLVTITAEEIEAEVDGLEPASKHAAQLCLDGVRALCAACQQA